MLPMLHVMGTRANGPRAAPTDRIGKVVGYHGPPGLLKAGDLDQQTHRVGQGATLA